MTFGKSEVMVSSREISMEKPAQFYHHCDGYLSGVGAELVAIFEEQLKACFIDLRQLPRSYEPEDLGDIHGDWEYLYLVEMKKDRIQFWVTQHVGFSHSWDDPKWEEYEKEGKDIIGEFFSDMSHKKLYAEIQFGQYGITGKMLDTRD